MLLLFLMFISFCVGFFTAVILAAGKMADQEMARHLEERKGEKC